MNHILEALAKLDTANDNHWTQDGLPRLETVRMLVGDSTLDRVAVNNAAPGFSRATPTIGDAQTAPQAVKPAEPPVSAEQLAATAPAAVTAAPAADAGNTGGDNGQVHAQNEALAERPVSERDQKTALEEELASAQAELDEIERHKIQVDRAYEQAKAYIDSILLRMPSTEGTVHVMETITANLAAQTAERERRAAQIKRNEEMLKGVDLKALFPKAAPIDQSRADKRGWKR